MSETVVHVTTLWKWKSVLDVWFNQGYDWFDGYPYYLVSAFRNSGRYLILYDNGDIVYSSNNNKNKPFIEYSDFMAQQKEDKEVKTYYVTQEQLDLIEDLKSLSLPLYRLVNSTTNRINSLAQDIPDELERPLLRYIGGDETIEFKVKEQLYRLSRLDKYGDTVYFTKKWGIGNPVVSSKNYAFTAPLDEIKKWQTPAWEIEKAD